MKRKKGSNGRKRKGSKPGGKSRVGPNGQWGKTGDLFNVEKDSGKEEKQLSE